MSLRRALLPALFLLATVALIPPAVQAAPARSADLPKLDIDFYTLPNGLQVILYQDHSTPIVAVNTWYHVGSKNERPGRTGFAHLFEHMMFQGSEHHDDEYFGPLQSIGARLNGSTNEDRTNYWQVVPSNHLERVLQMESDRMGWLLPAMTEEKFHNQQDVVRNERRQSEGRPYAVYWLNSNQAIFPKGHPYDHSVIGSHEDLEAATLDDVKDFFRTYYTPNNATLCIAGDFDAAQTKKWIEEYYGEIPPGPPIAETEVWVPTLQHEKRVKLQDRVQLTRLYYVWPTAAAYRSGDAELDLAAKILGQGKTSRLYRRLIHDTQLAQDVRVRQDPGQVASTFSVQITLRPEATAAEVEKILDEELARFRAEGPTAAELTRAQNDFEASFIKGLQRVGSWGSISDRLNRYNHYTGSPYYLQEDYDRYMNATPASVQGAFATWIGAGRVVFEVDPRGKLAAEKPSGIDRATLPAGGPDPKLELPPIARETLPNGLNVAVMEQHELPLVEVEVLLRSGPTSDPAGKSGLADLTGDLLTAGAGKLDALAFADALERLGTDLSVRTEPDYTLIAMTTLKKHLDESMGLLADALLRPAFTSDEFNREKERRLVDIRREADNPNTTADKVAARVLFGDAHPYSLPTTGTEASVKTITLDDVRQFARTHYTPPNAVLIGVGDITAAEMKDKALRFLGEWSGGAPPAPAFPEIPVRTRREIYLVDKPGDSQSTIRVVHAGVARKDPDWYPIAVANRILGGFFSSRLNLNLREDKGYTYGARSRFARTASPGDFVMSARVQTEVTAPALTEFVKELDGIHGARPVTADELQFAKNSIILGYPAAFETNSGLAGALTREVAYDLPEDATATLPEHIRALTLDQVNAAGREHFHPDQAAIVVVGDLSKIEDSVRALGLGPIHHLDSEGNDLDGAAGGSQGSPGARD
jgi:zinc protease